jgi:hypothetical protein
MGCDKPNTYLVIISTPYFVSFFAVLICYESKLNNWKEVGMAKKYGRKAQEGVEEAMHEHKHHGKYKSRDQAIAVGLNKARRAGGKVPKKK